ncbi:hypothetical protein NFI96_027090 [Prochilodus magdalenae]|nr:hypothetical protein NFI96_027090 [Prochilodus magdalenae]
MDPLDFLTKEELIRFFHCKKTEMSCMEEPHIFLHQLRDHNLVPEKLYKKVIKMKSKERRKDGVYQILDWLEKERSDSVHVFWSCVFRDHILQKYPVLRLLRNSLLDGSFRAYENLPEPEYQTERENEPAQVKETSVNQKKSGRKRKQSADETEKEEEEAPGPSCLSTPNQKKSAKKPMFSSPVRKGEKQNIWTWGLFKSQLPVTCGDKEGTLYRDKLARGGACIYSEGRWFTPSSFESFGGKGSWKNWKQSIRCQKTPLQKLLEVPTLQLTESPKKAICSLHTKGGAVFRMDFCSADDIITVSFCSYSVRKHPPVHLEAPAHVSIQRDMPSVKLQANCEVVCESELLCSCLLVSEASVEVESSDEDVLYEQSEGGEEEDREREQGVEEEEDEEEDDTGPVDPVFQSPSLPVSCGSLSGVLYKCRFASGSRSKSIRTEECWFTPVEFVKQEVTLTDGHWKKDIRCHDKTVNYLLKKKILAVHSLLCSCDLCSTNDQDQQNQDNDDVCFICDSNSGDLLCCDECPRAFHYHCHIPAVQDDTLGDTWACTYCVLKANQRWWQFQHMSEKEALDSSISQYTLHCEYLLLRMYREDIQHVFTKDPTTTVPGYSRVIPHPMWLDRVKTKLQKKEYKKLGQFVSDVRLIFKNCHIFNKSNEFGMLGHKLSELFEKDFQTIFTIQ